MTAIAFIIGAVGGVAIGGLIAAPFNLDAGMRWIKAQKRAALIAASERCERIAAAKINPKRLAR
jgi:hypothetical protein